MFVINSKVGRRTSLEVEREEEEDVKTHSFTQHSKNSGARSVVVKTAQAELKTS